ncbi:MAG: 6-bladed beta-propeller [Thermomicrobiales bacterium]
MQIDGNGRSRTMNASRFDNLARSLGTSQTRRKAVLTLGAMAPLVANAPKPGIAKPKGCRKGLKKCGRKCVALKKHSKHCGACGNACPSGGRCKDGQCVISGIPQQCVENDSNCGGCGKACSRDTYCRIGQCVPRYEHDLTITMPPLSSAESVFVDATGDIFVAGGAGHCVSRFTSSGVLKRTFGVCGAPGGSGMNQFNFAGGVVACGSNIIITDTGNNRAQIYGPDDTAAWMTLTSATGSGSNQISMPHEMSMDKDRNIYLADAGNSRVIKFNSSWAHMMQFGTGVAGIGTLQLNHPQSAVADRNGRVHVADTSNHRVMIFAPDGSFVRTFGSLGATPGRFHAPESIAVASNGDIFVSESMNRRVQQFDSVGNLIRVFELPSGFDPYGITVDSADTLYVGIETQGVQRYTLRAAKPSA